MSRILEKTKKSYSPARKIVVIEEIIKKSFTPNKLKKRSLIKETRSFNNEVKNVVQSNTKTVLNRFNFKPRSIKDVFLVEPTSLNMLSYTISKEKHVEKRKDYEETQTYSDTINNIKELIMNLNGNKWKKDDYPNKSYLNKLYTPKCYSKTEKKVTFISNNTRLNTSPKSIRNIHK